MRRNVSFEVLCVPQFADQFSETCDQLEAEVSGLSRDLVVIIFIEEVVPNTVHVRHSLQDHVQIIIGLSIKYFNRFKAKLFSFLWLIQLLIQPGIHKEKYRSKKFVL